MSKRLVFAALLVFAAMLILGGAEMNDKPLTTGLVVILAGLIGGAIYLALTNVSTKPRRAVTSASYYDVNHLGTSSWDVGMRRRAARRDRRIARRG